MKQEQKETTIKELFQQLKQEDERQAPSFAESWAAAQSRLEERDQALRARTSNPIARWGWQRWALAVAATILIACGFIVYRTIQNGSHKGTGVITVKAPAPQPPVKREARVEKDATEPEPRRGLRAPRPRRSIRPRLNTPPVRGDRIAADAQETESENLTHFFLLRYGDDHKPMESGEVIRVQMPRSALITLGVPVNVERADEPIMADLLIGEDGLARAIRFVR
jgi:hypothetical protein